MHLSRRPRGPWGRGLCWRRENGEATFRRIRSFARCSGAPTRRRDMPWRAARGGPFLLRDRARCNPVAAGWAHSVLDSMNKDSGPMRDLLSISNGTEEACIVKSVKKLVDTCLGVWKEPSFSSPCPKSARELFLWPRSIVDHKTFLIDRNPFLPPRMDMIMPQPSRYRGVKMCGIGSV